MEKRDFLKIKNSWYSVFCFNRILFVNFAFIFFPLVSFAASSGEFPIKEVLIQLFNFSVFLAAFIFLLRKPVKIFFHKRQEEFFSFEKQAVQLEKEKRKENRDWEKKLEALKEQEAGIKQKAQAEGNKFVLQKKEEIKSLRTRLKKESDFFLHLEGEKSKRDLIKKWKDKIIEETYLELEKQAEFPAFQSERLKDFFKQMETRL